MREIKCIFCDSKDIIQGNKFNDYACEDCGCEFDELMDKFMVKKE